MKIKVIRFLFFFLFLNFLIPIIAPYLGLGIKEKYLFFQLFNITRKEHLIYSIILLVYSTLLLALPLLWNQSYKKKFKIFPFQDIKALRIRLVFKYFLFILLSIPTIILLSKYIDVNRDIFNITQNIQDFNKLPNFWKIGIFYIVFWMLFVNFFCLFLYKIILNFLKKEENIFFYFPIFNSLAILIILVVGVYSNKNCDDLPQERYCGCIYLEAYKGKHKNAYQSLFNKKCYKYFD